MRNLSELNINDAGVLVSRPAPSRAIVAEFQDKYGITLPHVYLQLLGHSNGGCPELNTIFSNNDDKSTHGGWGVDTFFYLSDDRQNLSCLWVNMETWRPILGNKCIPFANDGGGNIFYLDVAKNPPTVKVCIHDEGFRCIDIAPSFETFIDRLEVDPDMI